MDAVLVVELDHLGPQSLEALLQLRPKPLDPAALVVAALGGDEEVVGEGGEGGADRLLALPGRVEVGGVDVVEGRLGDGRLEELAVLGRVGQAVGAEADARELLVAERDGGGHVTYLPILAIFGATGEPAHAPESFSTFNRRAEVQGMGTDCDRRGDARRGVERVRL